MDHPSLLSYDYGEVTLEFAYIGSDVKFGNNNIYLFKEMDV